MVRLDVLVDTKECVNLYVDSCGEMNAKTTHDITAMTAEEYSDLKSVQNEVASVPVVESKTVARQDRVRHEER